MNVLDAAYHTVHDYPGGAAALALRLGKSCSSLSHEVKPPAGSTAKHGLLDAVKIMQLAGDYRVLHAIAAQCGGMFVPLPELAEESPCAHGVARVAREFADVMGEVASSMADAVVSDNELARIERAWGELLQAGQGMLAHIAALNEAGKPAPLRVAGGRK